MATPKDPEKKRRGKATKAKKGEAATFEAGGAKGPANFDPAEIAERFNLWWVDGDGASFVLGLEANDPFSPSEDE